MKIILGLLLFFSGCFFIHFAIANHVKDPKIKKNECECIDYDCGCCADLQLSNIVNGRLCSNFSYLPKEYGISVTITFKDVAIFNETISARNPPPICVIHIEKIEMEICLHFYNLDIENKCFSGCAEFEIQFFKVIPFKKLQLGCFGCKESAFNTFYYNTLKYFRYKTSKDETEEPNIVLI